MIDLCNNLTMTDEAAKRIHDNKIEVNVTMEGKTIKEVNIQPWESYVGNVLSPYEYKELKTQIDNNYNELKTQLDRIYNKLTLILMEVSGKIEF